MQFMSSLKLSLPISWCLILSLSLLLVGCGQQILPDGAIPFERFTGKADTEAYWNETKVRYGQVYRNVLVAPYGTGLRYAKADGFGELRLGDFIRSELLHPEALGLALDFISKGEGKQVYVEFPQPWTRDDIDNLKVSVLPPLDNPSETDPRKGLATASEVLSVSQKFTTDVIHISEGAQLEAGMGFGVSVFNSEVYFDWSNESSRSSVKSDTNPIRFFITTSYDDTELELFSKTLTQNSASNAIDPWEDIQVDLESLAGKDVRFSFQTESANISSQPALAFPVWSIPVLHVPQKRSVTKKPNLIIISLDTLRADRLGAYGYSRPTSHNIDLLAKNSVLFENCFSSSSWTLPAHSSLFTGMPLPMHGAGSLSGYNLREEYVTIAELCRKDGYLTSAFTEGIAVSGELGFNQGFDLYSNGTGISPSPARTVEYTFDKAMKWLDTYGHLPFFQFLHTYEIHAPYNPPEPYASKFSDQLTYNPAPNLNTVNLEEEFQVRSDLYDGEIAYTDAVLGNFFSYLDKRKLLDNTILVILSDHGERFGEHFDESHADPFEGHGLTLFNEVLHVPCIIHLPKKGRIKKRVKTPISINDIYPTLLELMDVKTASNVPDSYSLTPLFIKGSDSTYDRKWVTSGLYKEKENPFMHISSQTAKQKIILSSVNMKNPNSGSPLHPYWQDRELIQHHGDPELALTEFLLSNPGTTNPSTHLLYYDLAQDPMENRNLIHEKPEEAADMLKRLHAGLTEMRDAAILIQSKDEDQLLTPEQEEAFRSLGYIE